jgi:hypothetical protein
MLERVALLKNRWYKLINQCAFGASNTQRRFWNLERECVNRRTLRCEENGCVMMLLLRALRDDCSRPLWIESNVD